ncbi:thiamine pyrophosphate-dependent dehydrogenase E1 component subunit alpha [Natronosalvus rutilus]|uniref:Thiamine pyrophosphate-dependent dehydrogenase E1 component subunit alpha n=1 Tax=Natronosalvus rutilus TaxID=2953753 RepID=A0A9E7NEV1_9EURY|nr:thiamine pyrophosphate-dependent dehydrogenase E1 component subunit alpha [Natronosalvus rutilus]UTF55763.1 thiamine pyrophosphate-dependent dehydrogenase E1 component subunit alpha [Natronosalvus rutilus]
MTFLNIDSPEGRQEALEKMLLARAFEDTVQDQFADGEIPGFVHLSQGQEAVAVGTCGALREGDYITSTHRAHGHSIAKGLEPDRLLAELYGKEPGQCRGKGGSMHVADLDQGMLGAQPIVGASAPLAMGAGITAQYGNEDWISLAFIGDGAVAEGQVHESFNLAATWGLPVVFVIENNLYSEGMVFDEQHNIEDLADMSASYGVPGVVVDGQDVEAVHEAVSEARQRALEDEGPTIIEAKTYRYRGHFEGDQQPYRSDEEIEEWRDERDPISNFARKLIEAGELTESGLEELRETAEAKMADALEFARKADEADADEAYEDVFVETVPEIEQHRERLAREQPHWGEY